MVTKAIRGEGIKSYCIEDLTPREMEQISEMRSRVHEILHSHRPDSEKKIYLTDDELFTIEAILQTLLGIHSAAQQTSAFDHMKKTIVDIYNQSIHD